MCLQLKGLNIASFEVLILIIINMMDIVLCVHLITSASGVATCLYSQMTNLFVHHHTNPDFRRSEIMLSTSCFLSKPKRQHTDTFGRQQDLMTKAHNSTKKNREFTISQNHIHYDTTFNVVRLFKGHYSQALCFEFMTSLHPGMSSITQGMVTFLIYKTVLMRLERQSGTIKAHVLLNKT